MVFNTSSLFKTSPLIIFNFLLFRDSFSGLRTRTVISCPCSNACFTISCPVPPVAPKIAIFIFELRRIHTSSSCRFESSCPPEDVVKESFHRISEWTFMNGLEHFGAYWAFSHHSCHKDVNGNMNCISYWCHL